MLVEGIDIVSGKALRIMVNSGRLAQLEEISGRAGLPYLCAGLFDMQVNGYRGIDYSAKDLTAERIALLVEALACTGTTRHLPTIITNSEQRIIANLQVIASARMSDATLQQAIPGVHLEGPFIASADGPRGAHDKSFVRAPSITELDAWQTAAGDLIRIITMAPELPGALDFIKEATRRGIIVSIGHTAATPKEIEAAVEAGARLSTHLGNGSHAQLPRLQNYLWEQLASDGLKASIISDGFHLPASVLKVMARTKGLANLVLVSDIAFLGGSAPGQYHWGDIAVELYADGHIGLAGTPYLAGAGHLLDWDIPRFAALTGTSLRDTIPLATSNPAKLLGVEGAAPGFHLGDTANILCFHLENPDARLQVEQVIFHDRLVYTREA
ncbi:MAG: N-acetylglucosamine-6-phosphate deacetylase [Spirochaetae bacterium HGW-Spirochaetae-8]|jgi:N-acetylglucosamine-6-phosphate deacetylase|nr:MAG: N-acetylglucosamine-6-phosphate deacetylase [Spirochaetae bacterium HGW-Spirochaetae-8]